VDAAGLTCRALEAATSGQPGSGEPDFYSKSRWGRWINGQSHPPRKAVKKLAEKLADDEIDARRLLGLWDTAFAPVARNGRPAEPAAEAVAGVVAGAAPGAAPEAVAGAATGAAPEAVAGAATGAVGGRAARAADKLAGLVGQECGAELNDRVLQGWRPLAVSWRPYAGPDADPEVSAAAPGGDTGDVGSLARYIREGHRLVVLGPGGAGKSTLAALLMEELLAGRRAGDRVPVLLPAASLVPGEMVKSWLERALADRYPPLRDVRVYGAGAIGDLVAEHGVLPVIDGLDELEPGPRGQLLGALSRAFGRREPLIMTCRSGEYHEAVEAAGRVLPGAAIISLQPVTAEDAASFLERGTAGPRARGLRQLAAALRSHPAGPLAEALSSPLMVGLVRSAYGPAAGPAVGPSVGSVGSAAGPAVGWAFAGRGDLAAGLAEPGDRTAVENRLLDALIGAAFGSRATSQETRPEQSWSTSDADRWLTFLARHLARLRSYDLDWVRLRYAMPAFAGPVRRAVLGAVLAFVLTGVLFGLGRGLSYGAVQGLLYGLGHGLDTALIVGAIYLLAPLSYPQGTDVPGWLRGLRRLSGTPLRTTIAIPAAYAVESGLRDGIGAVRAHGPGTAALMGVTALALNWAVAAALVGLAIRAGLFNLAERPVYFNLRAPGRGAELARVLVLGLAWGAGLGLVVGIGIKILGNVLALEHPLWGLGVPAGAVIGAAFALVRWGRTPVESAPAASPASTLRADRNLVLLLAVPFGVVIPVFFGAAFASGLHAFLCFGLYGLGIGLTLWLAIALSHAWPQYLITTGWLAARGRLPWRLAAFLGEAHKLQILRQRGGAYQFRHARLQDRLAEGPATQRRAPGHRVSKTPL
jgi:hypothetical protein